MKSMTHSFIFFLAVALFQETLSQAQVKDHGSFQNSIAEKVSLVTYYDCMRSLKDPLYDAPVFMKVGNQFVEKKSSSYLRGISVHLLLNSQGHIVGIQMGDQTLELSELKEGVQFGAFQKTMHTLEADQNFSPESGGKLQMGVLTSIKASQVPLIKMNFRSFQLGLGEYDPDVIEAKKKSSNNGPVGLAESLRRHYNTESHPDLWKNYDFTIKKKNGKWVILDDKGMPINTIYAEMKIENPNGILGPFVMGINGVQSALTRCPHDGPAEEDPIGAVETKLRQKMNFGENLKIPCKRD